MNMMMTTAVAAAAIPLPHTDPIFAVIEAHSRAMAAYEAAVECYETIQKQGRLVAKRILDPQTNTLVVANVKPHPAVAQMNAAWLLLKAFCSEFGLSPVSRTRLAIDKADDGDDELVEILSQPRERKQQASGEVIQ